ncbi:MAG: CopG family transcriptional regulator [Caulobacter sp.]|nr:CopG family transcriptional regulator [Caulobacter sp.]
MRTFVFPGIVEAASDGSFGLFFPDLPGCVTAADSLDDLAAGAREALQLHLEGMIEDGLAIPAASAIADLPHDPDINEAGILLVEALPDAADVVSLTLSAALLSRIDAAAQARGTTREKILAEGAEALLKAG